MIECRTSVVGRVDKHALHLARVVLLKRLECEQVVPLNQNIVEQITIPACGGVMTALRVFEQDARLQPRALFLAGPVRVWSSSRYLALRLSRIDLPGPARSFDGSPRDGATFREHANALRAHAQRLARPAIPPGAAL